MNMNAMTTPVIRLGLESSRGGMSGSSLRRSMMTKAPISNRPAAALTRMPGECQPNPGPCTRANTMSVTPRVTLSAPGRSNLRPFSRSPSPGDHYEGKQQRRAGQGDVNEEDRFPAERLRQKTADQHTDDESCRA